MSSILGGIQHNSVLISLHISANATPLLEHWLQISVQLTGLQSLSLTCTGACSIHCILQVHLTFLTHLQLLLRGKLQTPWELACCIRKLVKLCHLHLQFPKLPEKLFVQQTRNGNGADVVHACSSLPDLASLKLQGTLFQDVGDTSEAATSSPFAALYTRWHLLSEGSCALST